MAVSCGESMVAPDAGTPPLPTERTTDVTDITTDDRTLMRAMRAAHAHADATTETARFLDRMGQVPDPASIAEYASLLAREELTRDERAEMLREAGLDLPSLDDEDV
ncbi:hypothetical protein [Micromonospora sp. LOL_023]|uniref:hypothetical protein n=1 Tax=Micromonospora sp. LOL_023 TaxID=3345418 RepID=UPI003A8BF57C